MTDQGGAIDRIPGLFAKSAVTQLAVTPLLFTADEPPQMS
jgi:hypothetical protein